MGDIEGTQSAVPQPVEGIAGGVMAGEVFGIDQPLSLIDRLRVRIGALELQSTGQPLPQLDLQRIVERVGIGLNTRGSVPIAIYPSFCTQPALRSGGVEGDRPGVSA